MAKLTLVPDPDPPHKPSSKPAAVSSGKAVVGATNNDRMIHVQLKSRSCHFQATNSLAAVSPTRSTLGLGESDKPAVSTAKQLAAQLHDDLLPALKQGDCPPANAGSTVCTKNNAIISNADISLAATAATNQVQVPLTSRSCRFQAAISFAAATTRFATINFGSIIGLSFFRFKFSVYDLKNSGIKFGMVPLLLFIFQGPSSTARTISR